MNYRHFLASTAAILLAGCTTATGPSFTDDASADGKLFGEYLAGSYANYLDDAGARSDYYSRAYSRDQDDVKLGRRAVTSALAAGDMNLARTIAMEIQGQKGTEPFSRAVLAEREFAAGRYDKADIYLSQPTDDLTVDILLDLMKGWNEVGRGDIEAAKTAFSSIGGGNYFDIMGKLQTANLEASLGNIDAALEFYTEIEASDISSIEVALSKARAKSQAGDLDGALKDLEAFSLENGTFETGPVRAYIERLKRGESIDITLSPQQHASRALTEPSFGFFVRNRALDAGEVFLRMALDLDPTHDKARLWLGSILENADREDEAMVLYKNVPDDSPYIVSSMLSQANIYFAKEEDEKALATLEEANAKHPSFVTREALGRARLIRENYEDALPIYDKLVQSLTEEELKQDPQPLYFRGICYERTKQWELAVKDFQKVLKIDPDNADALNYLGYTWVDRGENLTEAFDMIRKAVELQPNSGAIVDSLGWAHYKLGQYSEARRKLEDAVALSPSSATIVDHLGDVYWKLGRFREAGYQWERALEFDPTDEEREAIKAKLSGGLDAANVLP